MNDYNTWNEYQTTPVPVHAKQIPYSFTIDTGHEILTGEKNGYILVDEEGEIDVRSQVAFELAYIKTKVNKRMKDLEYTIKPTIIKGDKKVQEGVNCDPGYDTFGGISS